MYMASHMPLLQNTEEEHADKQLLLAAVNGMTQVAAAINEFKRRKDLGTKLRTLCYSSIYHQCLSSNVYALFRSKFTSEIFFVAFVVSLYCILVRGWSRCQIYHAFCSITVRKYKATKDEGIGDKFSKLSVHSTKKKLARLSQKMVGPFVSR